MFIIYINVIFYKCIPYNTISKAYYNNKEYFFKCYQFYNGLSISLIAHVKEMFFQKYIGIFCL